MKRTRRTVALTCLLFSCTFSFCEKPARQDSHASLRTQVRELYSEDESTRMRGTSKLVAAGAPAIPLLISVLHDQTNPHFEVAWPAAARGLGQLKAVNAVPSLIRLLGEGLEINVVGKSDETLAERNAAFAALVEIGEPAVPMIRRMLPLLEFNEAYMALRVLQAIGSPEAREATKRYISGLEDQLRIANEVLKGFDKSESQ